VPCQATCRRLPHARQQNRRQPGQFPSNNFTTAAPATPTAGTPALTFR
jgi:hypothetical protein